MLFYTLCIQNLYAGMVVFKLDSLNQQKKKSVSFFLFGMFSPFAFFHHILLLLDTTCRFAKIFGIFTFLVIIKKISNQNINKGRAHPFLFLNLL